MELCPILEDCDTEIGCEGGGRLREQWWRQTEAKKQLRDMVKDILVAARERRRKSGSHGRGGGDRDAEESEDREVSNGYRDAGTDTGDAQVGELSCVAARRK